MPLPLPQQQEDTQDTTGLQPAADPMESYTARGLQTVNQSLIGSAFRGVEGSIAADDSSQQMSKEDAKNAYGIDVDGPVSKDYAQFKASQDAINAKLQDNLERAGSKSAQNTWLGFGVATAASMLDPIEDGLAVLSDGITKFSPLRPGFVVGPATSQLTGRVAAGVQSGLQFGIGTTAIQAAIGDDVDAKSAIQTIGAGALFLGLTHGMFGETPLKQYKPEEPATPAQTYNLLQDHLQSETTAAMGEAAVARSMAGQSFDPINDLVGLDKRIVAHEAALGGVELSLEERAKVLQSMDDGTYVNPLFKVTTDETGKMVSNDIPQELVPLENETKVSTVGHPDLPKGWTINKMEGNTNGFQVLNAQGQPRAFNEDLDTAVQWAKINESGTKATLPNPSRGQAGFINIEPLAQAVAKVRTIALQRRLLSEATTQPPTLSIGRSTEMPPTDLTEQEKQVTTALQPYEQSKPSTEGQSKPAVQAGPFSGTVGGTRTSNKATASHNWGGISRLGTNGESFLTGGGRIRFRNPVSYRHGAISFVQGTGKPFIVTAAGKGTTTPETLHSFGSYQEALEWVKGSKFNQFAQRGNEPKVTLAQAPVPKDPEGFEVMDRLAPSLQTDILRKTESAQLNRNRAFTKLAKYDLTPWSKDGGWWPNGLQHTKTGETFDFDKPEQWAKIHGEVKTISEAFIKEFRDYHDNIMRSPEVLNDQTGAAWLSHQLPKRLDELEGYRMFTLHNRNEGAPETESWSNDRTVEAHVATAILKDKDGQPHLVVFEGQGGYSKSIGAKEGLKMLADKVREYAQSKGLPVVLADTKTAQAVYGRKGTSATFTRAYSKGGYVRKAFNESYGVDQNNPSTPTELEQLWNPHDDGVKNFSGVKFPETERPLTSTEINAEEQAKEPGYQQAVSCVTGAT